jgi:aminoglycoside phosphotransferase family enzyme
VRCCCRERTGARREQPVDPALARDRRIRGYGAETHSAVVLLVGVRAYKVKKTVDLGFLDVRTLEPASESADGRLVLA